MKPEDKSHNSNLILHKIELHHVGNNLECLANAAPNQQQMHVAEVHLHVVLVVFQDLLYQ